MKKLLVILTSLLMVAACDRANTSTTKLPKEYPLQVSYDSLLAAETGADSYGMRRYVMALLKTGPNRSQDSTAAAQLQRAHMDNITRMAEQGKLVIAGPFFDDWEVKGIYIFAVETVEEAEELTKTDPAIQAGSLVMELHPWYGSAGLMKLGEIHEKLAKEAI